MKFNHDLDLKPCPFCGSDNVYVVTSDYIQGKDLSHAKCGACFASTMLFSTEKQAAKAWNRREEA